MYFYSWLYVLLNCSPKFTCAVDGIDVDFHYNHIQNVIWPPEFTMFVSFVTDYAG